MYKVKTRNHKTLQSIEKCTSKTTTVCKITAQKLTTQKIHLTLPRQA